MTYKHWYLLPIGLFILLFSLYSISKKTSDPIVWTSSLGAVIGGQLLIKGIERT